MTFENTIEIENAILETIGTARKTVAPKRVAKPKGGIVGAINAGEFENDLAQAFAISGNAAAMMRHYLNDVGAGWQHIIVAWDALHLEADLCDDDDKQATYKKIIASFRSTLSTASKELFEDGLTIKDGEIVKAKARNKASNTDPLVEFVKSNKDNLTDAQKASAIEAIKALMAA